MSGALGGPADGELIIKGAGQTIQGWEAVTVTRSVESIPSRFDIRMSTRFPGEMRGVIPINSPVQILIGGKVVITGYLDRITVVGGPESHEVRFAGRGRCGDPVDCAALISNNTAVLTSVTKLARMLVEKFKGPIQVIAPDGDGNALPFTFTVILGETPYDAIERIARYEGLLIYENADGNLVLSRVGKIKHTSGFIEGKNIQVYEVQTDYSQRFSTYIPLIMSIDTITRNGTSPENSSNSAGKPVTDPDIDRYRPRIIVSEQMQNGASLAVQRAQWEAQRRRGRSFRADLTVDSWLDSAGTPWTPNQVAPLIIPSLGLNKPDWIITDVTYRRDGRSGTTASLTLMPPEALTVEPIAQDATSQRAASDPVGTTQVAPPAPATAPNAGMDDGRRDRNAYGL